MKKKSSSKSGKTNKKPSSSIKKTSNKAKANYDNMRQIDWSYIDGPVNWD